MESVAEAPMEAVTETPVASNFTGSASAPMTKPTPVNMNANVEPVTEMAADKRLPFSASTRGAGTAGATNHASSQTTLAKAVN